MRAICFYFQVHQPHRLRNYRFFDIGNRHDYYDDYQNRYIVRRVAQKSYLPANQIMLDLIRQHKEKFKISYSISGVALEQFERYAPEVLDSFRKLADTGQVEFLSETYAHSLAALKSETEFKRQVALHSQKIKDLFGVTPKTFRNTELIYSDEIGAMVAQMGYQSMLTEGAKHVLGWKSPNYLYTNNINPKLKLLLKNFQLSDDIAFRFSQQSWDSWPLTAEKYTDWLKAIDRQEEVVNLFMDYETFGEHQWPETGIFDFLKHLPAYVLQNTDFKFLTPAEVSETFQPVSSVNVHYPISWADEERDLTAWLGNELQDEAFDKLYSLEKEVMNCGNERLKYDWLALQTSDHFYYMCTKWFSDGDVHKYFNPYGSPYDAFINYMNVISDFMIRLRKDCDEEESPASAVDPGAGKKMEEKPGGNSFIKPENVKSISDLKEVPKTHIKRILRNVDVQTLYLAMIDADEELKDRVLSLLAKRSLKAYEELSVDDINEKKQQQAKEKFLSIIRKQN